MSAAALLSLIEEQVAAMTGKDTAQQTFKDFSKREETENM